jgi:hypothetical protein
MQAELQGAMTVSNSIFSPSEVRSDASVPRVRSSNINWVSTVVTADLLAYVGAEVGSNPRDTVYVLEDPQGIAEDLKRRYARGICPLVNAKLLHDCKAFLVEEGLRIRNGEVSRVAK